MPEAAANPVVLTALGLTAGIGDRLLINEQDLLLREGERIGLVGRNGAGKSTLLRILEGSEHFFAGSINIRKKLRVSYLPQELQFDPSATVRENILSGAKETLELIEQYEHHLGGSTEELEREISSRDGWGLETRLADMASSLQVPHLDRIAGELSGGEKRRMGLCRALIDLPDLLLLDEPTNHLDTQTIEWLETYLNRLRGSCLFITHDRYFLDQVCNRIIELENGTLYSYPGNYSEYLRLKSERIEAERVTEERRISYIRREIDWIRRGPKARGTKSWSRIQRFNDAVAAGPPPPEQDVELLLPPAPQFSDIIARLNHVSLSLGGKTLFTDLNLEFTAGMRLGILGRNGLGKTSLLKILNGELTPESGTVRIGEQTRMNYSDQHRVTLHNERTVFEEIGDGNDYVMFGNRRLSAWTYLKRFLFQDEEINTQVAQLSGGERNRLVLAKILKNGGNFLLLDEPTNDLDLATLRVLEEALIDFSGCVAVVSHDRFFLNRVCTDILAFEGDGQVFYQPGSYEYYVAKRQQRLAESAPAPQQETAAAAKPAKNTANAKPRLSFKEQRELAGIEDAIAEAEAAVAEYEALFADPLFNAKYGQQTAELTAKLESAKAQVEQLYSRWEELDAKKG